LGAFCRPAVEAFLTGMPLKVIHEVELSRYPSPPQHGNATWSLLEDGSIGLLKITSFNGNAGDDVPMSAFFERVFTVSKLILDVRDNGGGKDELGRVLFSYFADRPFRYYRDLVVNKLSFRFFQYVPDREPLPPNVDEMVKPGADGKYHWVGHPNWGMQQPAAPHFGGKVVVLMKRWQLFDGVRVSIHAAQRWRCDFRRRGDRRRITATRPVPPLLWYFPIPS
jgi:hypothetical protein